MLFNAIDILLRWSKDPQPISVQGAINMKRTLPLEQRPTTYLCARRNQYETNPTDIQMPPHASGVIYLTQLATNRF
ncbi:hypothetical protein J5I95_13300 [Candidatus Poribacteria bacterium]|nr:hypothetical protein [Candidatus Poribacteria bacterium]